ncbi:hypothetical protein SAMN04488542_10577 [Fontibacillus panacisegetis]|uniref:Uncharacterized protein n=1 Tax=Fontibacillus panacisegetis TaxID=670482 RepID=A0A1G7HXN1_9BACL|nr:hypothetical protein [Fontibacillus panacisegetis]SDF05260.1 hypothetical protein SAMN04488542_10577 [Fontibacillus panacisegetis]
MSYEQVQEIEKYLKSKKSKSPEDISFARSHLKCIKKEIGKEELMNIKVLYQSKLSASPFAANYLAIIAILVSVIIFMLSTLSPSSIADTIVVGIASLIIIILMIYVNRSNVKNMQLNIVYTILINLIDEISVNN